MRILLVEDEVKTLQSLCQGLEEQQWTVDVASDGWSARRLASEREYDVIASDVILPGINGLELCQSLRASGITTPILMFSALGDTEDKVTGLDAGADDYLGKPFDFREFVARIKALARRPGPALPAALVLQYADLEINLDAKTVHRGGQPIHLTPRELALLEYFMRHPGKVLSKTEIAGKVWDVDFDTGTNVIEVYVNYLRNKVDKGFDRKLIHTIFGQGYVLRS
ncbi:MAG: response regulator transcription factor [Saprospirales bacterium]|nr:response regulator transcription factor [Saprospirales bacterium]MBK8922133.1 response regulator transcription factor [Saprospirales bacterium]